MERGVDRYREKAVSQPTHIFVETKTLKVAPAKMKERNWVV